MPNLLWRKDNQAIKFGQLKECNMKNISIETSYIKCGGETIPKLFSKKSKWSMSLDH